MILNENTNKENREELFKRRDVEDYFGFIEGDYEPSLGKKIKILIQASNSYIVYIDEEGFVEWTYNGKFVGADTLLDEFGFILNKISYLESLSDKKLTSEQKVVFSRLLGESVARILKEKNDINAIKIITQAEELLNTKSRTTLIKTAAIFTLFIIAIEAVLWLIKSLNDKQFNHFSIFYPYLFFSLSGGIGSFIFLMGRSKSLEIEPSIEVDTYKWEALLRIFYGVISGFVVYLAINSKIILGNINNPQYSITTFLICLISGASEKILPGIVKKVEAKI